ncbi:MAG: S-methyl-5-thioribose-1-phosphate isomerase [Chloroflexi bacterium]|nr:MAG: S-methyl-5-thioribose-1-phosphate isomerase [Chloroflexota bacterium]
MQLPVEPLIAEEATIRILDQTRLPETAHYITVTTVEAMWEAIHSLRIRGAPAIGIAAAYGLVVAAGTSTASSRSALLADLQRAGDYLKSARPTAVNLAWAVDRVLQHVEASFEPDIPALKRRVRAAADAILAEDRAAGRAIGEHGATLLRDGAVLTHCNAGGLATSGYGTALAPIYVAHQRGVQLHVYADETRPLLQGARITAWELQRAGVPVTVIADNMAATVLARGDVQAVIVGADRVAANGDAANKIGTFPLALVAHALGVPFYVALPTSTIDLSTATGADIPIEERAPHELTHFNERRIVPEGVPVFNPAFDVTPARYITAFITERGLIYPSFDTGLADAVAATTEKNS